uniref:Uncharacterized protein n=1 Tax=Meloidogyne enterolobii TaxID=390850 RepID=A0A6V7X1V8_MELEN|nr:unnamed protein product [Meloidogyne enterolobii]
MGVGPATSGSDSPFLSSMGAAPSSSTNDSPFLSSRTMIRGDCPSKVSRFDDSNVSCLENESVSSRDSSVCSSRRVGRPKKPSRKGIGGRKKQSECIEIDIENENVVINDEPIIFLAPDPPDMPVRQSIPVRQSERIKNRKLSITQDPIVQPIFLLSQILLLTIINASVRMKGFLVQILEPAILLSIMTLETLVNLNVIIVRHFY